MNTKKSLITIFSLFLLVILPACTQASESPQLFIPDIVSLKEYLPQLEQTARKWRSDAVLTWVRIPIQYDDTSIITTGFDSPTVQESILLRVKPDGKIELEKVKHEIELEIFPVNDWVIDSPEAFKRLLNENGMKFLAIESHRKCSNLYLQRVLYVPEEPVVWRLSLRDCVTRGGEDYYLDAISGERLYDLDN